MKHINVYGPRASGKTRNAQALAAHYQCTRVIDASHLGPGELSREIFRCGGVRSLILTLDPIPGMQSIRISDALDQIDAEVSEKPYKGHRG